MKHSSFITIYKFSVTAYKTIAKHFGCFERSFEEVLQTKGINLNELYKRVLGEK